MIWKIMPHYKNGCSHEGFVASYECYFDEQFHKVDLYVYQNHNDEQEVCIRTGNSPGDYISPGSILNVIIGSNHEPYRTAVDILERHGHFKWTPK